MPADASARPDSAYGPNPPRRTLGDASLGDHDALGDFCRRLSGQSATMVRTAAEDAAEGTCELSDALGLSIGTTNLVAARPGGPPVSRRSVLTLWGNRPAGGRRPVAEPRTHQPQPDRSRAWCCAASSSGSATRFRSSPPTDPPHRGEDLLPPGAGSDGPRRRQRRAADDRRRRRARVLGSGRPSARLRGALRSKPDAVSRRRAAAASSPTPPPHWPPCRPIPACPTRGVVALCDFGGSGTSITPGRRRRQPAARSARPAFRGVLRRPDRPGSAQPRAGRHPRPPGTTTRPAPRRSGR